MFDRFHKLLNQVSESLEAAQKTYQGKKRSELKDSDFLFPETRSFPIVTPADVSDAINNFGRMKGQMSYDAFIKKLYNKIKNKPEFVAALPDATKEKLGIKKQEASMLPLPTIQVDPVTKDQNERQIKKELVDEKNNDNEAQLQRSVVDNLVPANPNDEISLPNALPSVANSSIKVGDYVQNINKACIHYGSAGIVQNIEDLPDYMGKVVAYETTNSGKTWAQGQMLKKTPDQLAVASIQMLQKREPSITLDDMSETNDLIAEDIETETPEMELEEYKKDFYEMNLGSLRAIIQHAHNILSMTDNPSVKENLTESWLQGKIAITEDYMRTIHDFVMYVADAADTISAGDRAGLWENIRKKKERMGKNYTPAKPGDKDRPDTEQWKKLQEESKKDSK
ncbi:MAG: hypothetical protein EBR82_33740 [Caulobacteraceae bacterium]|nr:hypothetical protein [Caulobacteraceae bacterium]